MEKVSLNPDLKVLIERLARGDAAAETEIFNHCQRGLKLILTRQCNDPFLVDDICQETWRIVIEKLRKQELRDHSKLAAFIIQIGKNQLLMHFRTSDVSRVELIDEKTQLRVTSNDTPETVAEQDDQMKMVKTILSELSQERDRDVLIRYFIHDQDKRVICASQNIESGYLDKVIFRARQRFKMLWEQRYEK